MLPVEEITCDLSTTLISLFCFFLGASAAVGLQRMRESEAALRQLIQERDEAEREKWTILRHARDEAERCLNLTNQLALRDVKMNQLQEEVCQVKCTCCQPRAALIHFG